MRRIKLHAAAPRDEKRTIASRTKLRRIISGCRRGGEKLAHFVFWHSKKYAVMLSVIIVVLGLLGTGAAAASTGNPDSMGGSLGNIVDTLFGENTETVDIIILLTVLTLAPSILIMLTAFTRIIIVLGFTRSALGMQQTPPNQVIVGLALCLTLFVMGPVITDVYDNAYVPYTTEDSTMTRDEFFEAAMAPLRTFMLGETHADDIDFFLSMTDTEIETYDDTPNRILIPSFIISEIKRAFEIGFFIYIPFIVVDMVVASTLMSMGMMMLPPAMISLPFKILIFVMVDGWQLSIGALMRSFRVF